MIKFFLLLALGSVFQVASAAIFMKKPVHAINFNFGTHTEFYRGVQVDESGGQRKYELAPTIGAGAFMPLTWTGFSFLPEFNWVLPQTSEDTHIIKNILMLRADLAYDPLKWLRLRLGTSIMWQNIHGTGGSTKVDNGTGQSTFYYPDENRSSWNNSLDLGLEAMFSQYSFRFQTYSYSYFAEERRQLSFTLFFTYYLDRK